MTTLSEPGSASKGAQHPFRRWLGLMIPILALAGCAAPQQATPETSAPPASSTPPSVPAPQVSYDPAGSDLVPPPCTGLRSAVGYEVPTQIIPDDGRLGAREPLTTDVEGFVQKLNELPALTEDLRARVPAETEGLRSERFAVIPETCRTSYEDPRAEFADIVSGVVCASEDDVPELGPELPPEVAVDIARRFDAEAVPDTGGFCGSTVVLSDGRGGSIRLEAGSNAPVLVDPDSNRRWPIPDDILAELPPRGFNPSCE